ncbi:helix-turn-helix domain-containing protein [Stenotrophomonas maltophilia]
MNCYAPQVSKVSATPGSPVEGVSWQTERDSSGKRRSRMYYQRTEPERYTLSVTKRQGCSLRGITRILERHPSTISREVRRNATVA